MADDAPFYAPAYSHALPAIEAIRKRLPHFSSPVLRVQRVGQLDAELLDQELTDLLAEPVKTALRNVAPSMDTQYADEIYVLLRVVLYKFSIYDRSASYGAMLQNLKFRNEWAHRSGLQSTAVDAPLRGLQLVLYPFATILFPYLYRKSKAYMREYGYDNAPADAPEFVAWSIAEQGQRAWNILSFVNFALFLWNGRYRTIAARMLGMRLVYANRTLNRNVSFEFLNRQLVWNAFTEFLLFLLPLIRPRWLMRRLLRLPTHPTVLAALHRTLPTSVAQRMGLHYDPASQRTRLRRTSVRKKHGKYYNLPDACCAICFARLERAAGVDVHVDAQAEELPHVSIPNVDPLHPSKGLVAQRHLRETESSAPAAVASAVQQRAAQRATKLEAIRAAKRHGKHGETHRPSLLMASPNGIKYLDALATTPYRTLPCADEGKHCTYCYYCIAEKLLAESMDDALQEAGGWECLR
ncbi:Pex2p [Malassezia vespertilionis]|uniref:RING-type E3 ubiquitin transferase (cysteine targeting) n=2 Tax=Malassezia vespertilionis TaxID=2020962 RepID=A0A2N1JEU7_9BASI|nr:Pex2p [Malassezia vespertilionis]